MDRLLTGVDGEVLASLGNPQRFEDLGFVEVGLRLDPGGRPRDVSGFDGVRIVLGAVAGEVSLKLITLAVTNFDYHAVLLPPGEGRRELYLPFSDFRQLWSPQVPWTGRDVLGVSLIAGDVETANYAWAVDEIGFYRQQP